MGNTLSVKSHAFFWLIFCILRDRRCLRYSNVWRVKLSCWESPWLAIHHSPTWSWRLFLGAVTRKLSHTTSPCSFYSPRQGGQSERLPRVHPHCQHQLLHLCLPPAADPLQRAVMLSLCNSGIVQNHTWQRLRDHYRTDMWFSKTSFSDPHRFLAGPQQFFTIKSFQILYPQITLLFIWSEHVLLVGIADHW